jgi:hypothetical protein
MTEHSMHDLLLGQITMLRDELEGLKQKHRCLIEQISGNPDLRVYAPVWQTEYELERRKNDVLALSLQFAYERLDKYKADEKKRLAGG